MLRWLALVCLASSAYAQSIYRWTDARGEVHYSDDVSTIPRGVKAETTEGVELSEVPAERLKPTRPAPPSVKATPKRQPTPAADPGPITVTLAKVEVDVTPDDLEYIKKGIAAAAASPEIANWGPLRMSVEVSILPASRMYNDAFGEAVGLRKMHLRTPRELTLGRPLPYDRVAIHELAHLIEHQTAGQNRPRWFAEGFAQYVAKQDPFASPEDIAYWVIHDGGELPLDAMFAAKGAPIHIAYAIALRAVTFLVELTGEAELRKSLALRANGASFVEAFELAFSMKLPEFQKRFIESLRPHYYERGR